MTTDITELAQSLKAAAIDAKELAIIARYSKGRAAAEKFYALANPANVLALVEALEKTQHRIAELESRTVKMPEPFKLAKSSSGLTYYFADDVDAALTDAGIKVEAE
ncbi:ead/Ea22-like family protein [Klebsiella pneumoniae]|uniref:ead/Ea22-like family protein n=1 Tax=Klebsiella pneumoniae TaxID=573 RepID=UPI0035F5715E